MNWFGRQSEAARQAEQNAGQASTASVASVVTIKQAKESRPQFERTYTARLDNRTVIEVRLSTSYGTRYSYGYLNQPDGKYISFDPEAVAEKIIDPLLVPIVKYFVDGILQMDKEFIQAKPDSFIDESGQTWRRA
jgi:hypothetical protein